MNRRQTQRDAPHDAQNWIAIIVMLVGVTVLCLSRCTPANAQDTRQATKADAFDILAHIEALEDQLKVVVTKYSEMVSERDSMIARQDQILANQAMLVTQYENMIKKYDNLLADVRLAKRKIGGLESLRDQKDQDPATWPTKPAM